MDYVDPLRSLFGGVKGAVLSVTAATTRPLTLRQLADRAQATPAQVSKRVEELVELNVLCREQVGNADQIYLGSSAVADLIRRIGTLRLHVLDEMRQLATRIAPAPANITVFGSFARGVARTHSDIDLVIVRPLDVRDDDHWIEGIGTYRDRIETLAGNAVADIHVGVDELPEALQRPLWQAIIREGITIFGAPLTELAQTRSELTHGGS